MQEPSGPGSNKMAILDGSGRLLGVSTHPKNKNLKANPAMTKYRKYSKAKSKKDNGRSWHAAPNHATLNQHKREQMIDELVDQICDIATSNPAGVGHLIKTGPATNELLPATRHQPRRFDG